MSASAFTKKRAYIRCRIACSTPPMYWSTGIQRSRTSRSHAASSLLASHVAQEVPGRVDERVHRVRLAARRAAADRARRVHPVLRRGQRRAALAARSPRRRAAATGRSSSGTGHDAVLVAVDDRDRAAPVALAREQPVAQAVVDRAVALALAVEPVDDLLQRVAVVQAVELGRGVAPAARRPCTAAPRRRRRRGGSAGRTSVAKS